MVFNPFTYVNNECLRSIAMPQMCLGPRTERSEEKEKNKCVYVDPVFFLGPYLFSCFFLHPLLFRNHLVMVMMQKRTVY